EAGVRDPTRMIDRESHDEPPLRLSATAYCTINSEAAPGQPVAKCPQTEEQTVSWYTAHIVMMVRFKEYPQEHFPIWENIVLLEANSDDGAFANAEERGREDEGDDDGTFRWGGKPATWVFAGVRKLTLCEDGRNRPEDGTELSYLE